MNPELERRLRQFGTTVDAAADAETRRRAATTTDASAAVADLDNVVVVAHRQHRFYRALAVAAAAAALVAGGIIISVSRSSPSTSVGDRPSEAVEDARPPTTVRPTSTVRPTTTSAAPTSSSPPAPAPPTNATNPPVCPTYTVHNDYHLQICDQGPAVRLVQGRLRATIDSTLNVDGYFGPGTQGAVRTFQRMNGLAVDGQVGPATWALLVPDAPGTDTNGNKTVDPSEIIIG